MPFFAIQNFRFGLDKRRSEYTSQPGTLLQLENAHINEGGEIEKRQAFSRATGLASTFGLVAGGTGFYVFGSAVAPGGFPLTLFGQTVAYVRCQHPDGATTMTAIVSGTTFAGLPFCIAKFADGNNYPYYNGTLVSDYTSGLILASLNTNTKIGTAYAGLINTLSPTYTATDHVNGIVDVFNQSNTQATGYATSFVKTTTLGTLTGLFTDAGSPAVLPGAAMGQFSILSGTNNPGVNGINNVHVIRKAVATVSWWVTSNVLTVNTVSAHLAVAGNQIFINNTTSATLNTALASAGYQNVTVISATRFSVPLVFANTGSSGSPIADTQGQVFVQIEILNTAVDWITDNTHTAQTVAAQINSYASTPEFIASSVGAVVSVFTTDATAGNYNAAVMSVTARGNVCVGDLGFSVTATSTYVAGAAFTHIYINGVDINGTAGGAPTDIPTALQDVVTYINSQTTTTGYLAYSSGSVMRISRQVTQSNDAPISVNIVPVAGIGISTGSAAPLVVVTSPTILADAVSVGGGRVINQYIAGFGFPQRNLVVVSGGIPPYTHNWQPLNAASNPDNIIIGNGNTPGASFFLVTGNGGGQFVDVVTDSNGNVATSNPITILFT